MSSQEPETYLSLKKKPKAVTKARPLISLEKKRQNTNKDSDDPALPPIDAAHLHKSFQPPLSEGPDALEFLKDIREASDHGKLTSTYIDHDIPYYCGAFFKSGGERLHALYEFPYRAAFPPFLPAFFINALSCEGDIVHDPFGGSGTVAIEAARTGRIAYSSDINPLAKMITVPRIGPEVTLEAVDQALATVDWEKGEAAPLDLSDAFFHPQTAFKLQVLRRWLELNISLEGSETDHITAWIFMVVLARLTGHSQGYMSGYTLPPNQATTVARQRRINAKRGETPPEKDVRSIILKKTASLLRNGMPPFNSNHRIEVGPASDTPWIESESVSLVVTSPPFSTVVDYGFEHWLRFKFAGIEKESIAFSHIASLADWTAMIRETLVELMRVVKPGGYIAMEVGEIRRGTVKLERLVWQAAEGLPCRRLGVIVHDAKFTKSSHIYNVTNGVRGTNTNRIVLLQREEASAWQHAGRASSPFTCSTGAKIVLDSVM